AHPDELSGNAETPWHCDPQEWAKGYHHVIMRGDVLPSSILAIHEPWHGAARYMRDDDPTLESYQWLKEHDQDDPAYGPYVRGLRALERQRATASEGQAPARADPPHGGKEDWHPGEQAHFEYHCLESSESPGAQLRYRSHRQVTVLGRGDDKDYPGSF